VTNLRTILLRNTLTVFNALNAVIVGALAVAWWYTADQRLLLDSLGVCTVIVSNMAIGVVQEWRAYRAARAATILLDDTVTVQRGGADRTIHRNEILPGDVIMLRRGDAVPADGRIVASECLEIDASILTGESHPVMVTEGSSVYAGTACVAGRGSMVVERPAAEGLAERINAQTRAHVLRTSPMQRRINILFEWSFGIAVVLAAADVVLANGQALDVDRIRRIATLVLGLIPEGLVFFTTITLTLGVLRLAKHGIVVQHLPAVESFAAVTAVCMDKTGTLTENRLHVVGAITFDPSCDPLRLLAEYVSTTSDEGQTIDALRAYVPRVERSNVLSAVPFSSTRAFGALEMSRHGWLVLGSPERLLTIPQQASLRHQLRQANLQAMRVLVFTKAEHVSDNRVDNAQPLLAIALADSVRPQARELVTFFQESDVELHVCSGDAQEHVQSLLIHANVALPVNHIHARMQPDQKQAFVRQLQEAYHVAFVGDGINDLPAMKQADVSIAVDGAHGMARLVADIAFTRPAFHAVPDLVRNGRAVMRTILNVARLFIGKNVVLLLISGLTALGAMPYPLTPRRGALLSVLAVGIPAMVLAARGSNHTAIASFSRELAAYIVRTALAVVMSIALVQGLPLLYAPESLFGAIVVSVVVSAMFVDRGDGASVKHLMAWCGGLLLFWCALMIWRDAPLPVAIVQTFYELPLLRINELVALVPGMGIAAVVAVLCHVVPLPVVRRV
jgi:magnesium-transporting ATPase (P-type)